MHTLIVQHLPSTDPPQFQVVRGDHKTAEQVAVAAPLGFPVTGRPKSDLVREMQWYLEEFLDYPFAPNTDRAEHVLDALSDWGTQAFQSLFGGGQAGNWFYEARQQGYENLQLQIMSDDPLILQWPWEALLDPEATYLAVGCRIERRLNKVRDPVPLPQALPTDRINILLVTARPYESDVQYRSISRPLVELSAEDSIQAAVHVLRPPTFDNLQAHLKDHPHFYHLIHFDGHGGYGGGGAAGDMRHTLGGEGRLVFENDKGEPDEVTAEQLSGLLRDNAVPIMVLNACRSAMLDEGAKDPFASVAASLLKAGIRGVVAMSYSLYVSGAQEFLPTFYGELFASGDLSAATRAGRQKMFGQMKRVCARGRFELKDFIVPVIYQQESYDLSFAAKVGETKAAEKSVLPEEAQDKENPYGFIGRDRELLKLERAKRKDTPAILVHGLGGVGKTTLARGFVKWLNDTGGMDGCFWLTFIDIRSAEYVINGMGSAIFGPDFLTAEITQRIEALAHALREHQLVIVWDNFEVAAGIEGTYVNANLTAKDRGLLLSLLEKIRGGKTKVLITSRSAEDWLGIQRQKVSIGGLVGEERWEYCEKILTELGLGVNRDDEHQVALMDLLEGHPLAMRVILPKMEKMSAAQIIDAVKSNIDALGSEKETLYATLRFAVEKLAEDLKPLLVPLALHEQFVFAEMLEHMAKQVEKSWTREKIDRFCTALAAAGLLRGMGQGIFELHPALTGFLRSTLLKSTAEKIRDTWTRAFVDIMGSLADQLAPRELHEQRFGFHCHGANFHFALAEAERLKMGTHQRALTQSLAMYAQLTRDFAEANVLFERLAEMQKKAGDKEGEAAAYHQLGRIAQEQRNFQAAEKWYLESLAINEKLGNERDAAATYHQLGMLAQAQRDFKAAEKWYHKALTIREKLGDEHFAATDYHQLGRIAQEQRDFEAAEKWYLKSLGIEEKQGNEHGAAITYHQLGRIAQEQRDFKTAEEWYHKALTIREKLGDEHFAATDYHQLGVIAQEQRDFKAAEKWYLKALAIDEKQGNEHGAASTYGQLGIIAAIQGDFDQAGKWLIKCMQVFVRSNDPENVKRTFNNFVNVYKKASDEEKAKLKAMWQDAGLGELPS